MDIRDNRRLQKLTKQLSQTFEKRVDTYLDSVRLMLRPSMVFGQRVAGGVKEHTKQNEEAYTQFANLYAETSAARPFVRDTLPDIVELSASRPRLYPHSYTYRISTGGTTAPVQMVKGLSWVVAFNDFPPSRLRELVNMRERTDRQAQELRLHLIHHIALNVIMTRPHVLTLFDGLRFPIRTERYHETGLLPLTILSAPGGTIRPSDAVIEELLDLGLREIEEVLDTDVWEDLTDPLAELYTEVTTGFIANQ